AGARRTQGRHREDLGRHTGRQIQETLSGPLWRGHRRGAQARPSRHAHIFDLADAKGLMRAGVDALAHGVRDQDVDDEIIAMFKQRPNLILTPNLPDRGVKVDLSWLKPGVSPNEFAMLEAANTDRPLARSF